VSLIEDQVMGVIGKSIKVRRQHAEACEPETNRVFGEYGQNQL